MPTLLCALWSCCSITNCPGLSLPLLLNDNSVFPVGQSDPWESTRTAVFLSHPQPGDPVGPSFKLDLESARFHHHPPQCKCSHLLPNYNKEVPLLPLVPLPPAVRVVLLTIYQITDRILSLPSGSSASDPIPHPLRPTCLFSGSRPRFCQRCCLGVAHFHLTPCWLRFSPYSRLCLRVTLSLGLPSPLYLKWLYFFSYFSEGTPYLLTQQFSKHGPQTSSISIT